MPSPPKLPVEDEELRLEALRRYGVLDTLPEQGYEDVTELAAFICGVPISLVSLVDGDRQWFKSERGLGVQETPLAQSFCAHTLGTGRPLVVEDAQLDARFKDNPLVTGDAKIRFYAGAPIIEKNGHVLGTVCVIDTVPRTVNEQQISALEALARQVVVLLEQRRTIQEMEVAAQEAEAADRMVQSSERRLQTFVDSVPALAWTANADGWITWYNRRWYEYTGTTPEDMEGWGWQSVHDLAMLPEVLERWTRSIRTQERFEMVFPLRGADGVLRSFLTRVEPVSNEEGEVLQWFGTNVEIDEVQRTRLRLEESEAVLKQVLTATSDAVVSLGRDWRVTYVNPAAERMYGASGELVGQNLWEAFPDAVYEGSPFVEHYQRAMYEGVTGSFETEYGEPGSVTLALEVYPSKDGIVVFSRDVTKLKHATAAALQNEKLAAVGRLASSIAHEINNPLECVTNLLYLARTNTERDLVDDYLDGAERELRRVSAITNQTLRFYKQTTVPTAVTGRELFEETLLLYQGRLMNSKVQVVLRTRAVDPVVCFEGEIRQVVSNLMGNAIDAMHPRGGRLILSSRDGRNWQTGVKGLVLTVADTGNGMGAQVRKRVFEAFYSTKGIGGTGLGLWISKEIVERHGGRLRFRSANGEALHGTVFELFLPCGG